ncbi:MAG: type II toxin-antitoxin system mRNA interferase toxin, RelE/StbE family [Bdellovibrionales bacterium]|nr:type II toxin-antitoxin system mRNA interferase toxin, RelE/StbE family [Bdellovibrionales bacterium]
MVHITESRQATKDLDKAPAQIVGAYEVWARLVEEHGVTILRNFKGYHDEALRGEWQGYRSSRLNLKWRVIYRATTSGEIQVVNVERVTPHDYRRK